MTSRTWRRPSRIIRGSAFLAAFLCASVQLSHAADGVVVVLASNSGPYREALQGFQDVFGNASAIHSLTDGTPKIPSGTRVIVAIGGKAALYGQYPPQATLVYCLAPGTNIGKDTHRGKFVKIHTSPSVSLTLGRIKELQPSLKKLAVIWAGESIKDYFAHKDDVLKKLDVEMISERVLKPEDLPDHLRALKGKVDAIWLPPDAVMVTPQNFATIKEFATANAIPFYVPSEGLVEYGAVASFSASFKEIGALAAKMSQQALQGSLAVDHVFPEQIHYTINLPAARNANLKIMPEVLKQAEKVIR
jgi:putative tryptophan/tyrosine transport system substrate-binding protein